MQRYFLFFDLHIGKSEKREKMISKSRKRENFEK